MTEAFTVEASIERPPAEVWAALTDWERAPSWMDGVDRLAADGPTAAGTTLTFHVAGRDRGASIVEVEPGRRLVIRSVQGGVTADHAYALLAEGTSTRVTLRADCATRGVTTLLGPMLRSALRRADSGQLVALKRVVEAG